MKSKKKKSGFLVDGELEQPLRVEMELEFEGDDLDGAEAVSFEDVNEIAYLFKTEVNDNGASLLTKDESVDSVELNEVSTSLAPQNDDSSERMLKKKKNRFKFRSRFTGFGTARRSKKNRALTIERELHGEKKAADDMKRLLQDKLDEFVKANHTIKKGKVKDLTFKFDSEC